MSFLTGEKATEPRLSAIESVTCELVILSVGPTEHGGQGLGGIEEVNGRDSILPLSIDMHFSEGLLESRHDSGASGNRSDGHDDGLRDLVRE